MTAAGGIPRARRLGVQETSRGDGKQRSGPTALGATEKQNAFLPAKPRMKACGIHMSGAQTGAPAGLILRLAAKQKPAPGQLAGSDFLTSTAGAMSGLRA
jgi:hypothetical protein